MSNLKNTTTHTLKSQEQLLYAKNTAIKLAGFLIWRLDFEIYPNQDYIFVNEKYAEVLGVEFYKPGVIKYSDFMRTTYPDQEGKTTRKKLHDDFLKIKANKADSFREVTVKHINLKTGKPIFLEHHTEVVERYNDGSVKVIGGFILNVTEKELLKLKSQELENINRRLARAEKLALKSGNFAYWYYENNPDNSMNFRYGNDLFFSTLGLKENSKNAYLLEDFNKTIDRESKSGLMYYKEFENLNSRVSIGEIDSYNGVVLKHKSLHKNETIYLKHTYEVEKRNKDDILVSGGTFLNITKDIMYKKEIEHLLKFDSLTDLKNRSSFEKYLYEGEHFDSGSLIILDLVGLSQINEEFGYEFGNQVILFLSNVLREEFSTTSEIYRIGGDEFLVATSMIDDGLLFSKIKNIIRKIKNYSDVNKTFIEITYGYETMIKNNQSLIELANQAEKIMKNRKIKNRNSRRSQALNVILNTLYAKSEETLDHCNRLQSMSTKILKKLGYTKTSEFEELELICQIHDIGKIAISEEILGKPEKLTENEYKRIKEHSKLGYEIIKGVVDSRNVSEGVLFHHERFDGSGYPNGLIGDAIPIYARIVTITDAIDVMQKGRVYSDKKSNEEIISDLRFNSGSQFDPYLVEIAIEILTSGESLSV